MCVCVCVCVCECACVHVCVFVCVYVLVHHEAYMNYLQIKAWKSVEYRTFNFSLFPPHIKNIVKYSWKPLLIAVSRLTYCVLMKSY